jgi:hypothetical protein
MMMMMMMIIIIITTIIAYYITSWTNTIEAKDKLQEITGGKTR